MISLKMDFHVAAKLLLAMTIVLTLSSCSRPIERKKESKNLFLENMAAEKDQAYQRAEKVIDFHFPKDHSAHNGFKTEWWYFTGNLKSEDKDFGYQFTIFRNNVNPEIVIDNAWQAKNIFMGHMGLTDLSAKKFYSFEAFERESLELAGNQAKPFKVWLNHWYIKSDSENLFPLEVFAMEDGIGYKFKLTPSKSYTLQGDKGLSQKSSKRGNASYYYSYTRLNSSGEIYIKDKTYKVSGNSWMDREWSTSALGDDQEGWDWFALHFNDGTELMIYQLRNKDSSVDEFSSGVFVDKNSKKTKVNSEEFKLTPMENFIYKDHKFPIKWKLELEKLGLDLIVEARVKDQMHKFSIPYWEGAVKVSGTKEGLGYLEMTGY